MHSSRSIKIGPVPKPLRFNTSRVSLEPLDDCEQAIRSIEQSCTSDQNWIYAPHQQARDFLSGDVREYQYQPRVFGLPKTHSLSRTELMGSGHLTFLTWGLSFLLGIRLSDNEAGFLDATPTKEGTLVDFVILPKDLPHAIHRFDEYWIQHHSDPRMGARLVGAVHCLFLGQNPQLLDFEQLIYLYTSLDACYSVIAAAENWKRTSVRHADRISSMCRWIGIPVPFWASDSDSPVVKERNSSLHEALFFGQPLGYSLYGGANPTEGYVLLEMQALTCRLICAIIGLGDNEYLTSPIESRSMKLLRV